MKRRRLKRSIIKILIFQVLFKKMNKAKEIEKFDKKCFFLKKILRKIVKIMQILFSNLS